MHEAHTRPTLDFDPEPTIVEKEVELEDADLTEVWDDEEDDHDHTIYPPAPVYPPAAVYVWGDR